MPDENRSSGGPQSLALTAAEREFLADGTLGGYRRSQLEDRVKSKVKALPDRLSRLADDAELISTSDHLDNAIRQQVWKDLLRETTPDYVVTPETDLVQLRTERRPLTPPQELGRFIGSVTHDFLRTPPEIEREEVLAHVILGFVQGTYLDTLGVGRVDQRGFDTETKQMLDRVQSLASDVEQHRTQWLDWMGDMQKYNEKWSEARMQLQKAVREILAEEGIIESPPSLEERLAHLLEDKEPVDETGPDDDVDREVFTDETLKELMTESAQSVPRKTMEHLIAVEGDADSVPGTWGAVQEFQQKHDVDEFDPDKFGTRDRVLAVFQDHRIVGRIGLDLWLESASANIKSHCWRGVDALDVFAAVYEDGPCSSREIAKNIAPRQQKTAQVTRVARDLAGQDYSAPPVWDGLPILQGETANWQLTPYGEVLAHYRFEHGHWSIDAMPDSIIDQGIDELLDAGVLTDMPGV